MVAVPVDGPMGEDDVGLFRGEQAREAVIVKRVDDGAAVDLVGEGGVGFQDAAGTPGFSRADGGAAVQAGRAAISLAAVEIEERDVVAKRGVAGDGAAASTFGVAGMSAGDDDLQFRLGEER